MITPRSVLGHRFGDVAHNINVTSPDETSDTTDLVREYDNRSGPEGWTQSQNSATPAPPDAASRQPKQAAKVAKAAVASC